MNCPNIKERGIPDWAEDTSLDSVVKGYGGCQELSESEGQKQNREKTKLDMGAYYKNIKVEMGKFEQKRQSSESEL